LGQVPKSQTNASSETNYENVKFPGGIIVLVEFVAVIDGGRAAVGARVKFSGVEIWWHDSVV
jgi:hypothetical protein